MNIIILNSIVCFVRAQMNKMSFNKMSFQNNKKIHSIFFNRFQLIDESNLMRFEFVVAVIELKSLTTINIR